jgi:hypothetical protein
LIEHNLVSPALLMMGLPASSCRLDREIGISHDSFIR